jgi:RNA polymerase sigma factor (sigma-70 family)
MPDWQEILSHDGGAVWQTAYRILGNRADAEECFQEAFLAALEFSRRKEVQHWRALLLRLVTARAVDRLRRRRRQAARLQAADWDSLLDHAPTPPQTAEDAELAERLRTALGRIPPKQAEAFCLHCLEGWSYQEVAQQLVVSLDSVGVLLHRARKRLRQLLGVSLEAPRPAGGDPASSSSGPLSVRKEPS